jgi:hypothetical protein
VQRFAVRRSRLEAGLLHTCQVVKHVLGRVVVTFWEIVVGAEVSFRRDPEFGRHVITETIAHVPSQIDLVVILSIAFS